MKEGNLEGAGLAAPHIQYKWAEVDRLWRSTIMLKIHNGKELSQFPGARLVRSVAWGVILVTGYEMVYPHSLCRTHKTYFKISVTP